MTIDEALYNIKQGYGIPHKHDTLTTIIEYVKQTEPCEDCISRAELLKTINTWDKFGCDADTKLVPYKDHYVPYIHYDDVVKCIKGMPSIQPKAKWIPITWDGVISSFPDELDGHWVLFTDGKNISIERAKKDAFDHFLPAGRWFSMEDAIAWMPLPEPYKTESEETK